MSSLLGVINWNIWYWIAVYLHHTFISVFRNSQGQYKEVKTVVPDSLCINQHWDIWDNLPLLSIATNFSNKTTQLLHRLWLSLTVVHGWKHRWIFYNPYSYLLLQWIFTLVDMRRSSPCIRLHVRSIYFCLNSLLSVTCPRICCHYHCSKHQTSIINI